MVLLQTLYMATFPLWSLRVQSLAPSHRLTHHCLQIDLPRFAVPYLSSPQLLSGQDTAAPQPWMDSLCTTTVQHSEPPPQSAKNVAVNLWQPLHLFLLSQESLIDCAELLLAAIKSSKCTNESVPVPGQGSHLCLFLLFCVDLSATISCQLDFLHLYWEIQLTCFKVY